MFDDLLDKYRLSKEVHVIHNGETMGVISQHTGPVLKGAVVHLEMQPKPSMAARAGVVHPIRERYRITSVEHEGRVVKAHVQLDKENA